MPVDTTKIRVGWPYDPAVKPIPDGWSRDTAADGRFLQGSDDTFAGAANGGGAHNHTEAANHTHVGNPHTHTFSAGSSFGTSQNFKTGNIYILAGATHSHLSEASNVATITYSSDGITIDNADAKPPWLSTIIIKPDDIGQTIPVDALCFGDSATPPDTFETVAAGWDGRYIIGAAAAGAGGGTGGSTTHDHTSPVHGHTPNDHSHPAKKCGHSNPTVGVGPPGIGGSQTAQSRHHFVTLVNKALADVSNVQVNVQAASSEPAYIELLGIKRAAAYGTKIPAGIIVAFVGAIHELPSTWVLCNGENGTLDCTDRQVKITTSTGNIGNTGGSNTHSHTVDDHVHTHGSHNHSSTATCNRRAWQAGGTAALRAFAIHLHSWSVGATTPTMQNASVSLSSDDGRFDYRAVVWVKCVPAEPATPIVRDDPPVLFVPGWNDETRPDDFEPAVAGNWDAPVTRGWSANKCGITTWGDRVMADGYDRPCTLHPVRATPHVASEHANKERCRHHLGHYTVNDRGWTVPVYCCNPNSYDSDDYREGRGLFYVAGPNDPHCRPGNTCGVTSMPLPKTFLGFFHSNSWGCGDYA